MVAMLSGMCMMSLERRGGREGGRSEGVKW